MRARIKRAWPRRSLGLVAILVATVALLAASAAWAESVAPPSWRGQALSTTQEWDFFMPTSYGYGGALYDNPDGTGGIYHQFPWGSIDNDLLILMPENYDPMSFYSSGGYGAGGYWRLPHEQLEMLVFIPNSLVTGGDSYKDVRIQITYNRNYAVPDIEDDSWQGHTYDPPDESFQFQMLNSFTQVINTNWAVYVEDWRITANPNYELFAIRPPPRVAKRGSLSW